MLTGMRQQDLTTRRSVRCGFTIVEVLVVVTIIVVLVSLGTVAATRMRGAAETTSTKHLMNSLRLGLTQFEQEFGYYPPLLGDKLGGDDFLIPVSDADEKENLGFYSTLTLAPYLVGVGDLNRSGGGSEGDPSDEARDWQDDGHPGVGFADPGRDRSWGYTYKGDNEAEARAGYWEERSEAQVGGAANRSDPIRGTVYGPYVELGDALQFKQALDMRKWYAEGADPGVEPKPYPLVLYQFMDYWGRPIRYYRDWDENPRNNPRQGRELFPFEWVGAFESREFESVKTSLRAAPYVLFSSGRNREATDDPRDEEADEMNKDNLVEIGT